MVTEAGWRHRCDRVDELAGKRDARVPPVTIERSAVTTAQEIVNELRRGPMQVKLTWPLAGASECSAWLRDLLR